ncbi:MAG: rhodanese-like domain-containing protein [Tahibacter sp.]
MNRRTSIRRWALLAAVLPIIGACAAPGARISPDLRNPAIDMNGYLRVSQEAAAHRESRRVSETEFLRMVREPGTIILDARSKEKFDVLHVEGAINLSFPDITIASLAQQLPDVNARILIYCNNNFQNAEFAFPTKLAGASLNLSTYIALYTYGYRNVYELAPLVDLRKSRLPFVSSAPQLGVKLGVR